MTGSRRLSARFGSLRRVCRPMSWSALSSLVAMPFGQLSPRKSESRACYLTNVAADKRSSDCAWRSHALLLTRLQLNFGVRRLSPFPKNVQANNRRACRNVSTLALALYPAWEHTRRQALEIVPCSKPSARSSMICFLLAFVATFRYAKSWNQHLRVALFPPYKKGVSGEKFGLLGWFVCSMYLATLNAPASFSILQGH